MAKKEIKIKLGRPKKYAEETDTFATRAPKSKIPTLKAMVKKQLKKYEI